LAFPSSFGSRASGLVLAGWFVAVLAGAALLRLVDLDNRPMHCDEAGQALKFGRLLERGDYVYDPYEYHGPSLNYLTLPIAHLASAKKLTAISETHLRLLPAIFGMILIGLVWLVRDHLGRPAALCAAVLTAVSPAMVFYSRYYIQEMLLVCFTFGALAALWRFTWKERLLAPLPLWPRQGAWLVVLGLCIGMMHATKETCSIAIFAMAVASVALINDLKRLGLKRAALAALVVLLAAASVSILFFSSFGRNPHGVVDSVTTYSHYLGRASGKGSAGWHDHPWYYYLQNLFWWHCEGGSLWTELPIAALALVGLVAAAWGKGLGAAHVPTVRFLGIYTLVMILVYSAIPYKTPWCALGFLHGMILLAGVGATALVRGCEKMGLAPGPHPERPGKNGLPRVPVPIFSQPFRVVPKYILKAGVIAVLIGATVFLAFQAYLASFVANEDPGNPYVYAHTTSDVPLLAQRVREIAAVHPDGTAMHVQVICPEDDFWPLPWYLRDFRRIGWYDQIPEGPAAPLIIIQPPMEKALQHYLYVKPPPGQRPLYVPVVPEQEGEDWLLRPYEPLWVYVQMDLRDAWQRSQESPTGNSTR